MKYYISPFYLIRKTNSQNYLEHKYIKNIVLVCEITSEILTNKKNRLFGIKYEDISLLKEADVFNDLILYQVIIDQQAKFQQLSSFFTRPLNTIFNLPFIDKSVMNNAIAIFGVPYNFSNPNINVLDKSFMTARNFGTKYNYLNSIFKLDSKIKKRKNLYFKNVYDIGDIFISSREDLKSINNKISSLVKELLLKKNKFIVIGGDHGVSYPIMDGVKSVFNDIVCVHIDAHNDIFMETEVHFDDFTPSHSSVIAKLLYQNIPVYSLGLRDYVNYDSILLDDISHYRYFFSNDDNDFSEQIKYIINELKDKKIYLSIDLDVLDLRYFSSVTDPLPNGIKPTTLVEGAVKLIENLDVVALDMVEANLSQDNTNDIFCFLNILKEIVTAYEKRK